MQPADHAARQPDVPTSRQQFQGHTSWGVPRIRQQPFLFVTYAASLEDVLLIEWRGGGPAVWAPNMGEE